VDGALKNYVSVFETEYVPVVKGHYPETDDYILSKQSGLYPDVLTAYPLNKAFVLHAERHKSFWIKVKGELPCGTHTVEVVLSNYENQELQRAIFQLEVIDYRLPQCTIPIHSWLHCDCICEQHGVKPYSKKFYSIFGEYLKSMCEHGVNTLYRYTKDRNLMILNVNNKEILQIACYIKINFKRLLRIIYATQL
jgi:hypothetical protein